LAGVFGRPDGSTLPRTWEPVRQHAGFWLRRVYTVLLFVIAADLLYKFVM
jgi:hypothetical protein